MRNEIYRENILAKAQRTLRSPRDARGMKYDFNPKKSWIALVGACLLLILAGCNNLFNPFENNGGQGYVSIMIGNGGNARTIMPRELAQNDFAEYEIEIFKAGETTDPVYESGRITTDELSELLIPLNAGIHDLYVYAYLNEGDAEAAAYAEEIIVIAGGQTVIQPVQLTITDAGILAKAGGDGEGIFSWEITYPDTIEKIIMTITPFDPQSVIEPVEIEYDEGSPWIGFIGERDDVDDSITDGLTAGFYRVVFRLHDNNGRIILERREILHIYEDMESRFEGEDANFSDALNTGIITYVTTGASDGAGSLRQAILDAPAGSMIVIDPSVKIIELTARLVLNKNLTIEGNGVTITRAGSWTDTSSMTQLMQVSGSTATIRRIHFKDGRSVNSGAAIANSGGNLTLESCIFSGNQTSQTWDPTGGAIYTNATLRVLGCTFYNNHAGNNGGAIYQDGAAAVLTIAGNLFYGNNRNKGPTNSTVIHRANGTVTSLGYNVVDVAIGTGSGQSGWVPETGDKTISSLFDNLPISTVSFRPISGGTAVNVITELPVGYPTVDFYGNAITPGAAAGAVQSTASGFFIDLTYNSERGNITSEPQINADSVYPAGNVTLTAIPESNYIFDHWLIDGEIRTGDQIDMELEANTIIQAVFIKEWLVGTYTDQATNPPEGTLRHALANALYGDIIRVSASGQTIALEGSLILNRNITIEGNGLTITRAGSWTSEFQTPLLSVSSSTTATIRRVHFKDGRASSGGTAISNNAGILTLESCIFSGNQVTSGGSGGTTIRSQGGIINVLGCTFYNNSGGDGAIYLIGSSRLNFAGNLFIRHINLGINRSVVYADSTSTITSLGYNVVDVSFGTSTGQSGWAIGVTGDKSIGTLFSNFPISPVSFKLLQESGAANVITELPDDYPAFDFYGNAITVTAENGAAAGAVQSTASGSGFLIDLTYNNTRGSVEVSPTPDADGLCPAGNVTLTATPGSDYILDHWLVDGEIRIGNQIEIELEAHTRIQAVFIKVWLVETYTDQTSNPPVGTLRHALANALDGDIIRVSASGQTIALADSLVLTRSIIIEGNSVIITRASGWTTINDNTQLLRVNSNTTVTIKRVHFKDGRSNTRGAAITNSGNLTLESCIFSNNQTSNANAFGGAIYSTVTLRVLGCSFYNNIAEECGAIGIGGMDAVLILSGNLFYGNNNSSNNSRFPVVSNAVSSVSPMGITSLGYNVVDVPIGTSYFQSFWAAGPGDKSIGTLPSNFPISSVSFKLLQESGAANVITELPDYYPAFDFYGNAINPGAAAGAVQSFASGSGFLIDLITYNRGSVEVSSTPDADGLYPAGNVTLTATPDSDFTFGYWLVDGEIRTGNQIEIELEAHTRIQAVFIKEWLVNTYTDQTSNPPAGTLRHALNNAQDGDTIRISASGQTIALAGRLSVSRNITIEGNGVSITRLSTMTSNTTSNQLLTVTLGTMATIRRVHFKDGRASDYGAAIRNEGNLTLETCIFSGNQTSAGSAYGGAIYTNAILNVLGCTFYNNRAGNTTGTGGAIYQTGTASVLILAGNLFFGNNNGSGNSNTPVVHRANGTVTSLGYNVVDVAIGTADTQSGWAAGVTGDATFVDIGFDNNTTIPFVNAAGGDFTPLDTGTLRSRIPAAHGITGFPTVDFLGATRTWPGAPGAVR